MDGLSDKAMQMIGFYLNVSKSWMYTQEHATETMRVAIDGCDR